MAGKIKFSLLMESEETGNIRIERCQVFLFPPPAKEEQFQRQ